jgi:hypothetical protein
MAGPGQGQPRKPRGGASSGVAAVRLRRVNRWRAEGLGGKLADLYGETRETSDGEAHRSRQDFLNRLTADIRRPADPTLFRALVLPLGERTAARLTGLAREAWTRWPG